MLIGELNLDDNSKSPSQEDSKIDGEMGHIIEPMGL